eukprot:6008861-Pyramimonas_sp.AAC.1
MCAACSSRARCATFGARVECARCACARGSTHRKPVGPHHPCRKPVRNRGGVAIAPGGPTPSRRYASALAAPVKNQ